MLNYETQAPAWHGPMPQDSSSNYSAPRVGLCVPSTRHIFVVYGPAGSGKTCITRHIEQTFNLKYIEGDEFHPPANVAKMAANIPLEDADRWDWLIKLREAAVSALEGGAGGVVLACSALKRKYRDVIRIASINEDNVRVHFLCLQADRATLVSRIGMRKDHFMGRAMVDSQLQDLEPAGKDEIDIITIDVRGSQHDNKDLVENAVGLILSV